MLKPDHPIAAVAGRVGGLMGILGFSAASHDMLSPSVCSRKWRWVKRGAGCRVGSPVRLGQNTELLTGGSSGATPRVGSRGSGAVVLVLAVLSSSPVLNRG